MARKKIVTCPVRDVIEVIEGKWTVHIIVELINGTKRHSTLAKALPGINPKTLTERLRDLETSGIVSRKMFEEIPPRVEYSLTKRGLELTTLIQTLKLMGLSWMKPSRHNIKPMLCPHCDTINVDGTKLS
jgi:DNA-binding HxlR family transcriptional regulator